MLLGPGSMQGKPGVEAFTSRWCPGGATANLSVCAGCMSALQDQGQAAGFLGCMSACVPYQQVRCEPSGSVYLLATWADTGSAACGVGQAVAGKVP